MPILVVGAIGVVFGDIGTSPLYTMREAFGFGGLPLDDATVLGVLSLVFWALLVVVTVKYVAIIMRADNQGQGGVLALATLALRGLRGGGRRQRGVIVLAMVGAALFYGDGVVAPAISVLSAVEGLKVTTPAVEPSVVSITLAILVGLFLVQRSGTGGVGKLFGPIMCICFAALAVLGLWQILGASKRSAGTKSHVRSRPISPPRLASLRGAWRCRPGGDRGRSAVRRPGPFGRWPIRFAWFSFVLPALLLNYSARARSSSRDPGAVVNPFYRLAPSSALYPMVVLATWATVIASQAVVSRAFSLTRQAIQLGYVPRLEIRHTSEQEIGQLPAAGQLGVLGRRRRRRGRFGSSSELAAAYGIAVVAPSRRKYRPRLHSGHHSMALAPGGRRAGIRVVLGRRPRLLQLQWVEDPRWRVFPDRFRRSSLRLDVHVADGARGIVPAAAPARPSLRSFLASLARRPLVRVPGTAGV